MSIFSAKGGRVMIERRRKFVRAIMLAGLLGCVAVTSMGTSCIHGGKEKVYLVPEEDTAREQMLVAEQQLQQARGVVDKGVRHEEITKAIRAYEAVEQRFPDDERYTPAAALFVGHLYRKDLEQFDKAIAQYKHVLKQYPNQDDVRIEALFGTGDSYNRTNRPRDAQVYFKQLLDEYGETRDPRFREIVERTRALYRQVRTLTE